MHKPEDVIRPVTMEKKISSADSHAHLQADECQLAEQFRQNGLGRGLLHLVREEVQQQKEQNIICLCLLHLGKADTMNLQYVQRRN